MQVKAIKSGDRHLLEVTAAPYGGPHDRDADGQYFSPRTEFALDKLTPMPVFYHGFKKKNNRYERVRKSESPVILGKTIGHRFGSDGPLLTIDMDMTVEESRDTWKAAERDEAVASSGSVEHLARYSEDGEILFWPMAEISLWPKHPAMPQAHKRATAIPALKAAGIEVPDDLVKFCESEEASEEHPGQDAAAASDSSSHIYSSEKEQSIMEEDKVTETKPPDITALVNEQVAAALKAAQDEDKAQREVEEAQQAAIKAAVEEATAAAKAKFDKELEEAKKAAVEANRLPYMGGASPHVAKFGNLRRFDNASPDDLAFAHGILASIKMKTGVAPSEDLAKAIAIGFVESADENHGAAKGAMKAAGLGAMKADELNQTTLAGFGDEWIGQAYSSQVWEQVRLATPIVSMLPSREIPQGHESMTIPIETTAPTFYKVAQASAQDANPGRQTATYTSSKLGTGNRVLTANKMGAKVAWAEELNEDSIVNWAGELRRILVLEQAEVMEHLVIDGDTAAGALANINDIGGTPGAKDIFTLFDGFRKVALANAGQSRDGGALAVEDYLDTVQLLGTAGINGWNKAQTSLITDIPTAYATLKLSEVKTRDSYATPTVENGTVTGLWGYKIFGSANMHRASANRLANAAGNVDQDTPANNTKGGIVAVRWDQWMMGFKRRVSLSVDYDPESDSNCIFMHSRVGLLNRDTSAAGLSYNLTV